MLRLVSVSVELGMYVKFRFGIEAVLTQLELTDADVQYPFFIDVGEDIISCDPYLPDWRGGPADLGDPDGI